MAANIFSRNSRVWRVICDAAAVIAGALIFSASLNMFLLPAEVVVGGLTGIATVLKIYFDIPVGTMIFVMNVPLVLLNAKFFGRKFFVQTIIGIAATSLASDLVTAFPVTITDPLLCALFGGGVMGFALGILLSRGYTTGGTDLMATLLKIPFKRANLGTLIMVCDFVIIIGAALITKNYSGIFYSILASYIMGKVTDYVISGSQQAEMAFIISKEPEKLAELIAKRLDRGATIIEASGSFTKAPRPMLMCVVGKGELFHLKQLTSEHDPESFVIISRATEVLGEGFGKK